MKVLETIKNRRSIRKYKKEKIDISIIDRILEAAQWAPSGLNNQPWKFLVLSREEKKRGISEYTKYSRIIIDSACCICVFLDLSTSYNREKDIMAIGAGIQNMLLAAQDEGIGTCWLGEILNEREKVEGFLETPDNIELMAVITLGIAQNGEKEKGERKKISELFV